jgi:hypothetical protein
VWHDRSGKIRAGQFCNTLTELIAQHASAYFLDRAFRQICELEWAERNADQSIHTQPEVPQHVSDLTILTLADCKGQPDV